MLQNITTVKVITTINHCNKLQKLSEQHQFEGKANVEQSITVKYKMDFIKQWEGK